MQAYANRTVRHCRGVQSLVAKPVVRQPVVLRAAAAEEIGSSNGTGPQHTQSVVDFAELSDIIRMVHDTDIIELELKSKKFTLNLRKKEALQSEQPVIQYVAAPAAAPAPVAAPAAPAPAPAAAPAPKPAAAAPAPAPTKIEGLEIRSPMAGTFYKAAAPGEAPFVKPGDHVKKGQVVGIVEAMKLMNEIEAEVSGEVVKVLVDNGSPITAGQAIILVKQD